MTDAPIQFIDTTLRDGNQSLWGATGLRTGMMLEIATVLDQVGYHAIDFSASTHMAMAVRYHQEDPWERLRLMKARMPRTPLSFLSTGMRFISWETAHPELMALSYQLLVRHGIERFTVMDPMNDVRAMIDVAQAIAQAGATEIVSALVYTISPFHDDDFYARMASALAASGKFHRLYLKDPGGLLTPERAGTLLPAIQAGIQTAASTPSAPLPLELHSHCTIGLAPFTYAQASQWGVAALHTAARPVANGASQPAIENTVTNLRAAGVNVDLDMDAAARVSTYFARLARAEGLPTGVPAEYDHRYFQHQLPGGMIATMTRQLRELRQAHRLPEVFDEVARVRAELGYPIMVTPFSQVVGAMAVMNVLSARRYDKVPDEVIRYAIGRFGTPPAPLDPNVRDRIVHLPRARELAAEPAMPGLAELRQRFAGRLSDEEFILRAVMPAEQVDAMKAAGPCRRAYDPAFSPVEKLLGALATRPDITHVRVEGADVRLSLTRHARATPGKALP